MGARVESGFPNINKELCATEGEGEHSGVFVGQAAGIAKEATGPLLLRDRRTQNRTRPSRHISKLSKASAQTSYVVTFCRVA